MPGERGTPGGGADAVDGAELQITQLANSFESFGLILDLLSRRPPFMDFGLAGTAAAVRLQLLHRHHVAAVQGKTLVGYFGWMPTSRAIAEAWQGDRGPLKPILDRGVDTFAVTLVVASSPAVVRRLVAASRALNPGGRAVFKRAGRRAGEPDRKGTVLNWPPAR